jgi:hypothetical protein
MKWLIIALSVLVTGCASNNSHRPECKFSNLKPGQILPHHCGDWGNPGSTTITVRPLTNGTYVIAK